MEANKMANAHLEVQLNSKVIINPLSPKELFQEIWSRILTNSMAGIAKDQIMDQSWFAKLRDHLKTVEAITLVELEPQLKTWKKSCREIMNLK